MWKKRKIDFILYEDDNQKIIFRFYPRKSSCHSFNNKLPTNWEEVYKVYYAYAIFQRYKENGITEVLLNCHCDECSVIGDIAYRISQILEGKSSITVIHKNQKHVVKLLDKEVYPFGYGVSWIINKCKNPNYYRFTLWNYEDIGYRFEIEKDKMKDFGLYLESCCDYMLEHGDPI